MQRQWLLSRLNLRVTTPMTLSFRVKMLVVHRIGIYAVSLKALLMRVHQLSTYLTP